MYNACTTETCFRMLTGEIIETEPSVKNSWCCYLTTVNTTSYMFSSDVSFRTLFNTQKMSELQNVKAV